MTPSPRLLMRLLAVLPAVGLFLLISANPLAQSNKLPAPSSFVSDFAGVIDSPTKSRLENLLSRLKEKSNIELYVATVENTGEQQMSAFSRQLARDWNIGTTTNRSKSLLLVVCSGSKTSFTQMSRNAQLALPEGILGEIGYRMNGPLSDGRFAEAVDSGVHVFANAVADKVGFKVSEIEENVVATKSPEVSDSPSTVLVSARETPQIRPRVVADPPRTDPSPTDTPSTEPTTSESPKSEPAVARDLPKPEVAPPATSETATTGRKKPASSAKTNTPVTKKTAAQAAEDDLDEIDEVELTLTKPLPERAVLLKQFLDTHPNSKARPRAIELLISTHAGLGDQKLKNGDVRGGIQQLLQAIEESDTSISDKLFSGVVAQIPLNLYLRGERDAAFKAAQNLETKFGSDPKRLLAVAGFYLGIERSKDTVRVAENAVKLAPELAEAHRLLAVGLHISLRLDEAMAEYKRTLELDPTSKVSRGSLADLYRASGKPEEALALYNEQLAADPKDKAAQAGKVISLLELNRAEEANTALNAAYAAEPNNLPLLAGAAYWFTAHGDHPKAFELARRAIAIEPRYTWGQLALAHAYLGSTQPLDAERAVRFARQYGKFPTLAYELASVLSSMGFYDEAAEALRESFTIKDDQIQTYLAGTVPASDTDFLALLAPERKASIYQPTAAGNADDAKTLKGLLALNVALNPGNGEKVNEAAAVAAAKEFTSGSDGMRPYRQVYAASRLLRNDVGVDTALALVTAAKKGSAEALKVPAATLAVQADEFRELRARSISAGNVPDVVEAPPQVLANIFKGRLEDLEGWSLFNQEKYSEAITHLKLAAETAPKETPAWRSALWHLGVTLEQSGKKQEALDAYIQSYRGAPVDSVRQSVIEQLYKRVNGSLDGLAEKLGMVETVSNSTPVAAPTTTPEPTPAETPKPETPKTETPVSEPPKSEATPAPTPSAPPEMSDEALKNAAARVRSNIKITGRVVDANKTGIPNVTVVLISPSGTVIAATTDNDGNYSFKVTPSQKTYRVIPSMDGFTFTPVDRTLPGLFEDLKEINFVGVKP